MANNGQVQPVREFFQHRVRAGSEAEARQKAVELAERKTGRKVEKIGSCREVIMPGWWEFWAKSKMEVRKMSGSVTEQHIKDLMAASEKQVFTVFGKCTIVAVKLPNGFVLTESSACVDPANYDEELGVNLCIDRITDKLWELEGYLLQNVQS